VDTSENKRIGAKAQSVRQDQVDRAIGLIPWEEPEVNEIIRRLWREQEGQDIAEYAVMLAVILVIVVGTIRLIGSNANKVFSSVASSIQ
jgi:Flp pilus assembly pilin Flp